jgi:hypothetical protein
MVITGEIECALQGSAHSSTHLRYLGAISIPESVTSMIGIPGPQKTILIRAKSLTGGLRFPSEFFPNRAHIGFARLKRGGRTQPL